MITTNDPVACDVLRQRCQDYIDAHDRMKQAMEDGFNVHGAIGGLIGSAHMLEDQVQQMQESEQTG